MLVKILTSTDITPGSQRRLAGSPAGILARDFLAFVKRPTRRRPRRGGAKKTARAIVVVLALNALFTLLVCLPTQLVLNRTIGLDSRPVMQTGAFMFAAVAIAPFMEEVMFRAGLRSARWTLFALPVLSASLLPDPRIAWCLVIVTGMMWLVERRHRRRLSVEALAHLRWKRGRTFIRHYALVVYCYAFLFAAAHVGNFVVDPGTGWKGGFLVLAVMSQLMNGLACSYLRLRYGLSSSIAAHVSWNALMIGLTLLGL